MFDGLVWHFLYLELRWTELGMRRSKGKVGSETASLQELAPISRHFSQINCAHFGIESTLIYKIGVGVSRSVTVSEISQRRDTGEQEANGWIPSYFSMSHHSFYKNMIWIYALTKSSLDILSELADFCTAGTFELKGSIGITSSHKLVISSILYYDRNIKTYHFFRSAEP